jgi:putative glycosyltransferase (TIGR04372 family)
MRVNLEKSLRKFAELWKELPILPYGVLHKRLTKYPGHCLNLIVKIFILTFPVKVISLVPNRFHYLFLTASYDLGIADCKVERLSALPFPKESEQAVKNFIKAYEYYTHGRLPNFERELAELRLEGFEIQHKKLEAISGWSFWTVNHSDFNTINGFIKVYLESLPKTGTEMIKRYLPHHTSHLGHLAMLFLYINYYRKRDPKRILVLPQGRCANKYLLDLIISQSPMKIEFAEIAEFARQSPRMIDTLHYSLDVNGEYRTESDCSFYSNQVHPEFLVEDEFKLKLNTEERKLGRDLLEKYLGRGVSWFITIHVREPKNKDLKFSQARDSNIANYAEIAKVVNELGGLVVRMGDQSFPKLPKSFAAFDYAHSSLKSDFMDVWLWSESRKWIGNVNGAAFPPIAFRTPRILLDQWYWNLTGPSQDVVVQKKVIRSDNSISKNEAIENWRFSRAMSRVAMKRSGYTIREVEPDAICKVVRLELECSPDFYDFSSNQMRLANE